jgi:hypothetical protein
VFTDCEQFQGASWPLKPAHNCDSGLKALNWTAQGR